MSTVTMTASKQRAIALSLEWAVLQYLPRHRFSVVISRCHTKGQAAALKEAICRANSALSPNVSIEPIGDLDLVEGENAIAPTDQSKARPMSQE